MKIYLKKFYNNDIPLINKKSIYEDIKNSYFGGVTEVYKPYGESLYYYDVNSLYTFAALNTMPGNICRFETNININLKDMKDVFGFFYCEIETTDSYLGLLPIRNDKGIIMPTGKWSGWYFSPELEFANANGYNIKIIKGYHFNRVENMFDKYVKHFYDIKLNSNDNVDKAIAKRLLNHLLGRFGLDISKPGISLINAEKLNEILQTKRVFSNINIGDIHLTSYENKISKEICDQNNVDYRKSVVNNIKSKLETEHTFSDVSISIVSAITSYARIYMAKKKLAILNKVGKLFKINIFFY